MCDQLLFHMAYKEILIHVLNDQINLLTQQLIP